MKGTNFWDITPCSPFESQPTFRTNVCAFLLFLFFDLKDGADMFLRNAGWFSTDYMALFAAC
jgi:hypothetical protein